MATFLSPNIVRQASSKGGAATRRSLLGGSAALAGAGALATVPSLASAAVRAASTATDPVLALYRRYCAIDEAQWPIDRRLETLRAEIVARCGEPPSLAFDRDPDCPALRDMLRVSDRMGDTLCDLIEEMTETPAATPAGVAAKLRIGIAIMSTKAFQERVAHAFMTDALRFLEDGRA
jgi:hypothetical protein